MYEHQRKTLKNHEKIMKLQENRKRGSDDMRENKTMKRGIGETKHRRNEEAKTRGNEGTKKQISRKRVCEETRNP
jgi:hypothetical protein